VIAAGFTHRDHEQSARGFAAGGPLDQMEPGPVLAGFADDAIDDGLAVLSDDDLVGLLCAARRLSSWTASIELRAVSHLYGRRAAHDAAAESSRQAEHVVDEVAAALTLTRRSADRLLSLAAGVTRLPAAAAALAAGRIDMPRAIVFTDELAGLADVAAAAVAALVAPDAPAMTTSELRRVLHRAVLHLDPGAARKRREKAQKNARVECWTEPSGTWSLAGRDLPPADVLAADKHIDARARELKAAGTDGSLDQLRARVFAALLSGRPLYTLLPGQDDTPGDESPDNGTGDCHGGNDSDEHPCGSGHCRDGQDGPGWPGPEGGGTHRPEPGPPGPHSGPGFATGPTGLTGSVNLTVPLTTWLGLTSQPGEVAGHGPLEAAACRDLAAAVTTSPGSRWCLTITNPDGTAIGHGCAKAGYPPPVSTPPPRCGPPGRRPNADNSGLPGPRAGPGDAGDHHWLAGIKINWLETGACGHARETFAYQPSPALRRLIKTRNRRLRVPGLPAASRPMR
jgi:hypothetical protein